MQITKSEWENCLRSVFGLHAFDLEVIKGAKASKPPTGCLLEPHSSCSRRCSHQDHRFTTRKRVQADLNFITLLGM